jgi:endonuclease III
MRDISTDDLVTTLMVKCEAAERARCVYAVHPTAQNAKAQNARDREVKDALRALNTHLRECLRIMKATQHIKMPRSFIALTRRLPARTVAALKTAGVKHPEHQTLEELLQLPGIGVQGVACIAVRAYAPQAGVVRWPELDADDD